jgi:VanZ family protein
MNGYGSVKTTAQAWRRWAWIGVVMATIALASGQSEVAAPGVSHIDKVGHFLVFGLLATLVVRALPPQRWGWAIVLVAGYGFLDEWRQSFTPGRLVEVADWVADTAGALVATVLYVHWRWYRELLERKIGRRHEARVDFAPAPRPDGSAS